MCSLTIFTLVIVIGVYGHIENGLKLTNNRVGADIIIMASSNDIDKGQVLYTAEPSRKYIKTSDLAFLDNYKDKIKDMSSQFFSQTLSGGCCSVTAKLRVVGFDQKTDFIVKPWMQQNNIENLGENEVIIGSDMNSIMGSNMKILGEQFSLVGSMYKTGTGLDRTIFMNIDKARKLTDEKMGRSIRVFRENNLNNLVSSVFINVENNVNIENLVSQINNSQDNVKAVAKNTAMDYFKEQLRGWTLIVVFLILALLINVATSLYGRFNSLARERRGEIGYLRAMGLKKIAILKLIVGEAWIMSLTGGFIGSFIALIILPSVTNSLEKIFTLPSGLLGLSSILFYLVLGLVSSLILGLISSLPPAIKAMKMEPQEAMSKGGLE